MTDVLSLIEAAIAVLIAISPIIIIKWQEAKKYLAIIQSILGLLRTYGNAILDGTITDEEYMNIGKDFSKMAVDIHLDEAIKATIPGLEQNTVDKAVNLAQVITK